MAHTPGPWYVYGPAAECVATDALGERGVLVATAALHGTDYRADARLIAAAPDLLEAAREALDALRRSGGTIDGTVADMLAAAVAKAEGNS